MILICKCGKEFERNGRYGRKSMLCPPCRLQHKRDYNREYARTRYADMRQAIPRVNGERPSSPTPEWNARGLDSLLYHGVDISVQETIHRLCKPFLARLPGPVHVYTPEEIREYERQHGPT